MANCQCGNDSCQNQEKDSELCCMCSDSSDWCLACLEKFNVS